MITGVINNLKFLTKFKYFNIKKKVVIFDNIAASELESIIIKKEIFIFKIRKDQVNEIYFNKKILVKFLKYFFIKKLSFYNSYISSVIEVINPKIIITFIDNSLKFFDICRILGNKFKFIAIQNASRYDILRHKHEFKKKIRNYDLTKKYYIPNFYCFGQYEIDHYKKHNIQVKNFLPVGSLKLANAINFFTKKKIYIKKNRFDICLISETAYEMEKNYRVNGLEYRWAQLAKNVIKYSIKNNKKLVFAIKRTNKKDRNKELHFYKEYLSKEEFRYLMKNSVSKKKYGSYKLILESNVVIAINSTLLREKLAMKGKILNCNYSLLDVFNFPLNEFYVLNKYDYNSFKKKLDYILNLSEKKFFQKIKKKEYIIKHYNKNALNFIKKNIFN